MKKILSLVVSILTVLGANAADQYKALQYIESTGADRANVFTTPYVANANTQVDIKFNSYSAGDWRAVFSGRNGSDAGTGFSLYQNGDGTHFGYFVGGYRNDNMADVAATNTDFEVTATLGALVVNGTTYETGQTTFNASDRAISLFANPEWDNAYRGRIYYCKISENEDGVNTVKYDFQPVMRNDGQFGYYDEASKTFIAPVKGSFEGYGYAVEDGKTYIPVQPTYTVKVGETVKIEPVVLGPSVDITYRNQSTSLISVDDDGVVTGVDAGTATVYLRAKDADGITWLVPVTIVVTDKSKELYSDVDYIYFDGANETYKHYYETGYLPKWNTEIDVNFKGYDKSKGSWRAIFSGRDDTTNGMSFYQNSNGTNFGYFVSGNNNDFAGAYSSNTDYTVHFTKDALTVNGEVLATKDGITEENFKSGDHTISIFSGSQDWPFYGQISYFKISEGGATVHEYVPVVRHDGTPFLYDKTTETYVAPTGDGFYTGYNEGTTCSGVTVQDVTVYKNMQGTGAPTFTNLAASDYTVTYNIADPTICTIAEDGTITGTGIGTTSVEVVVMKADASDIWRLTYNVTVIPSTVDVENVETCDAAGYPILGSFRWSGDSYKAAYTATIDSGMGYDGNYYNHIFGTPAVDEAGNEWYAENYAMTNSMDATWSYNSSVLPNGWSSNMGEVYVRRYFTVTGDLPETIYMPAPHDDAPCEYYINGVQVWSRTGNEAGVDGWYEAEIVRLTADQKALIKTDGTTNVFAYHVHQNWGGRYADGGLYGDSGDVANSFTGNENRNRLEIALAQAETVEGFDPEVLEYAKNANVCLQDAGRALDLVRYELKKQLIQKNANYEALATTEPADGLECYLYNVGTGMFLAGNNDWGTHASVESNISSWPMVLRANTSGENRYAIQTNLPNGARGANDGLGHNGYVDCGYGDDFTTAGGWAWEFQADGNGNYRIINCGNGGDNIYLGVTKDYRYQVDTDKAGADEPNNLWKIFTKEQFEAIADKAAEDNPADLTYLIHQANFSQNDFDGNQKNDANADLNDSKWERNAGSIWNWKGNDANGDYAYEMWNATGGDDGKVYLQQTVEGLRAGKYVVACQGYYRDGSYEDAIAGNNAKSANFFATSGETTVEYPLCSILDDANQGAGYGRLDDKTQVIPDGCNAATHFFQYGAYTNQVEIEVGEDGTLIFGVYRNDADAKTNDWIVVDNFHLIYLGVPAPEAKGVVVSYGSTSDARFDVQTQMSGVAESALTCSDGNTVTVASTKGKYWSHGIVGTWTNTAAVEEMNGTLKSNLTAADFAEGSPVTVSMAGAQGNNSTLTFDFAAQTEGQYATIYTTVSYLESKAPLDNITVAGLTYPTITYAVGDGDGFVADPTFCQTPCGLTLVKITGFLQSDKKVVVSSTSQYVDPTVEGDASLFTPKVGYQVAGYIIAEDGPVPEFTLNFSAEYDENCDQWGVYADGQKLEYPYDKENPYKFVEGTQISVGGICIDAAHTMVVTVNGEEVPEDAFDPDTKVYTFTLAQDTEIKIVFKNNAYVLTSWTATACPAYPDSWGWDNDQVISGYDATIEQYSDGTYKILGWDGVTGDDMTFVPNTYGIDIINGEGVLASIYMNRDDYYLTQQMVPYDYVYGLGETTGYIILYGYFYNIAGDPGIWGTVYLAWGDYIVTGINGINANDDAPVYNIGGQRVKSNAKGIVIKNGKKYFQK